MHCLLGKAGWISCRSAASNYTPASSPCLKHRACSKRGVLGFQQLVTPDKAGFAEAALSTYPLCWADSALSAIDWTTEPHPLCAHDTRCLGIWRICSSARGHEKAEEDTEETNKRRGNKSRNEDCKMTTWQEVQSSLLLFNMLSPS